MLPHRVSLIFWLIILALLPLAFLPPFGFVHWPHDRLIVSLALLGILAAMLWRAWMRKRIEKRVLQEQHRRYEELKREILTIGGDLRVEGASGIWILIACAIVLALMIWGSIAQRELAFVAGAGVFTPIVFIAAVAAIPAIGRPALILTHRGIQPAGYGVLPWSDIEGIEFTALSARDSRFGYMLRLYVPNLGTHLREAHPLLRAARSLLPGRKFQHVVNLRLRHTSEPPPLIDRLCRDLWKAATGRDHPWSIQYSPEEMELTRNLVRMQNVDVGERLAIDPQGELERLQVVVKQFEAVRGAHSERLAWNKFGLNWFSGVVGLFIAYQFVNTFTNFVASAAWSMTSFWIALAGFLAGCVLFVRDARKRLGNGLRGGKLAAVAVSLLAAVALAFPMVWMTLQDLVGDPSARTHGVVEEITTVASKTDSERRRGCDERLRGTSIGDDICLSQEQFSQLPNEARVRLTVRRSWAGYHVDAYQLESQE